MISAWSFQEAVELVQGETDAQAMAQVPSSLV